MFLEHFGSKKSNHCVFSLFFAHPGCDNCVEGSVRNSKAKDDVACPVFDRQLLCISLLEICQIDTRDLGRLQIVTCIRTRIWRTSLS